MAKWIVIVEIRGSFSGEYEIEADTEDDAEDKAADEAIADAYTWAITSGARKARYDVEIASAECIDELTDEDDLEDESDATKGSGSVSN